MIFIHFYSLLMVEKWWNKLHRSALLAFQGPMTKGRGHRESLNPTIEKLNNANNGVRVLSCP